MYTETTGHRKVECSSNKNIFEPFTKDVTIQVTGSTYHRNGPQLLTDQLID